MKAAPRDPGLAAKVAFLRRPDAYPERPRAVEAIETHFSWVFLTDTHAWKLKKPVRYDSLDFRTPALRCHDCEEEVRLNRRLAPDVYLGVVPLTIDAEGRLALGGAGEVVDWLVHMRRLPHERMLDHLLATRPLARAEVEPVARLLARFFARAEPALRDPKAYRARPCAGLREDRHALALPSLGLPAARVRARRRRLGEIAAVFLSEPGPAGDVFLPNQKQRFAGNRFVKENRLKMKRDILNSKIRIKR